MPLHGQIYYKEALTQTADGIFRSLSPHLDIVCEVFWHKMAGHIKGLFWPDRWSLSGLLESLKWHEEMCVCCDKAAVR